MCCSSCSQKGEIYNYQKVAVINSQYEDNICLPSVLKMCFVVIKEKFRQVRGTYEKRLNL